MSKCTQCNQKEVSSPSVTGELCTSCFFKNKAKPNATETPVNSNNIPNTTPGNIGGEERTEEIKPQPTIRLGARKEQESPENPEHRPSVSQNQPQSNVKYCQSCIERGYGLRPATREWKTGYFICQDCFEPLINNVLGMPHGEIDKIKTEIKADTPALTQFYELLQIPETLRFANSEDVLNKRNDIFTHHANAIVNMDQKQITERIEELQVMLFQIKVGLEPLHHYISKVKRQARDEAGLASINESKNSIKGPSKVKLSKLEKEAKAMLPHIKNDEERMRVYAEMVKQARQKEFDKIVGS